MDITVNVALGEGGHTTAVLLIYSHTRTVLVLEDGPKHETWAEVNNKAIMKAIARPEARPNR